MRLRIGSVPYLNAKPLVDWFHSGRCNEDVEVIYAVPSLLAQMLRDDRLDVANVSIFEGLQNPALRLVPDISISANGAVKSVRLFTKVPLPQIRSVALDTGSLTSSALIRILLKESFGLEPVYTHHAPHLGDMMNRCDAALLIGDLKLFDLQIGMTVYDLGKGWLDLTGLPFVYAGWLAREDRASAVMTEMLTRAKMWGTERLDELAAKWAIRMDLPLDRCRDYLLNVMNYDLSSENWRGLKLFQEKCFAHGLVPDVHPLRTV